MADNGKEKSGIFASNVPNWTDDTAASFENQPASRAEVANYVNNAFKQWFEPDHMLLLRTVKVMETMLQFMQEVGLEVVDGRAVMNPASIQAWGEQKMAEAAAAAVPKDQQS